MSTLGSGSLMMPQNLIKSVVLLWCCATAALASASAHADDDARPRLMVVPAVALGDVRAVFESRIAKGVADQLRASQAVEVVTDKDKVADKNDPKKGAPKVSAASKRIDEADSVRQTGIDLQAEGKAQQALDKYREAIDLYEKAYLELVDFSKWADAYARAGVVAFAVGKPPAEVTRLFEQGIAILPTLVIDRRKQDKALLELFDATHDRLDKAAKSALVVEGSASGKVDVFVDGVKIGDKFPVRVEGLLAGTHYAQVRGEGMQPWGAVVKVKGKEAKVTAKLVAVPQEEKRVVVPATVADLAACAKAGQFHQVLCKEPLGRLAKQTGAAYFVFAAVKADRYGRLTVHPFLVDAAQGAVPLKPIELAADLSDLNRRLSDLEADVAKSVADFPKARVLNKVPAVFTAK